MASTVVSISSGWILQSLVLGYTGMEVCVGEAYSDDAWYDIQGVFAVSIIGGSTALVQRYVVKSWDGTMHNDMTTVQEVACVATSRDPFVQDKFIGHDAWCKRIMDSGCCMHLFWNHQPLLQSILWE